MSLAALALPVLLQLAEPCPAPAPPVEPAPTRTSWADPARVRAPSPRLTLEWAVWQLVPSPELAFGDAGARFGLQWQLTPLSYSFGIDPRLSPWRSFVVEPIVRHSGSLEVFVSPEYLARSSDRLGVRAGVRSYFGLLHRGDYLSVSLAAAYLRFGDAQAAAYELGAYVLFGMLGLQLSHAPNLPDAAWIGTLRVRFF
ncbi:MAG TPA: hypothetical protein VK524_34600 [Polyangiaceae bacterium]|nr:hypothetical protein [Polyangiaceae bacterium]